MCDVTDDVDYCHDANKLRAHLEKNTFAYRDPSRFKFMSESQLEAFRDLQVLEPRCVAHGSTVYCLATQGSDVDVCVPDVLSTDATVTWIHTPFNVVEDLLHLRVSRLILRHTNGTLVDVVDLKWYKPEYDEVLTRICAVPVLKAFFHRIRGWIKDQELAPADGFPNSFTMMLVGIHFLQLVDVLPPWQELAGQESPCISFHLLNEIDAFPNFLDFLYCWSRKCRMDLTVGKWQPKSVRRRDGTQSQAWHLRLPNPVKSARDVNVFAGFHPNQVHNFLETRVLPDLEALGEYPKWLK